MNVTATHSDVAMALTSTAKRFLVWLGMRHFLSTRLTTWLIQRLGLKNA